ncbi:unnamed protein product [Prorocentrum cordatum]|uniref:Selenoprotein O n=1 Tax=Prorocentrum cordatum TaxID=2364126 RepID=A0ABN9WMY2_9DINO|nr:unnamed protein product [Polarella glacialis]
MKHARSTSMRCCLKFLSMAMTLPCPGPIGTAASSQPTAVTLASTMPSLTAPPVDTMKPCLPLLRWRLTQKNPTGFDAVAAAARVTAAAIGGAAAEVSDGIASADVEQTVAMRVEGGHPAPTPEGAVRRDDAHGPPVLSDRGPELPVAAALDHPFEAFSGSLEVRDGRLQGLDGTGQSTQSAAIPGPPPGLEHQERPALVLRLCDLLGGASGSDPTIGLSTFGPSLQAQAGSGGLARRERPVATNHFWGSPATLTQMLMRRSWSRPAEFPRSPERV